MPIRWRECALFFLVLIEACWSADDYYVSKVTFCVLLGHLFVGVRWQLWPLVSVELIALIIARGRVFRVPRLSGVLASIVLRYLFPIVNFPEPSGAWSCGIEQTSVAVGEEDYSCHRSLILEALSKQTEEPEIRAKIVQWVNAAQSPCGEYKIQVTIYYPVERHRHKGEGMSRWTSSKTAAGLAGFLGLPRFLFQHITDFETAAVQLAPLSRKKRQYPSIIVSHGVAMSGSSLSQLAQTLACNGFVVLVPNHADGTALLPNPPLLEKFDLKERQFKSLDLSKAQESPSLSPLYRAAAIQQSAYFSDQDEKEVFALDDLLSMLCPGRRLKSSTASEPRPTRSNRTPKRNWFSNAGRENIDNATNPLIRSFRWQQIRRRSAELRACIRELASQSRASGSWLRDRIDWECNSIVGCGLGAAAAMNIAIVDRVATMAGETLKRSRIGQQQLAALILVIPWLDPLPCELLELTNKTARCLGLTGGTVASGTVAPGTVLPQSSLIITPQEYDQKKVYPLMRTLSLLPRGNRLVVKIDQSRMLDFIDLSRCISPMISSRIGLCGVNPKTNNEVNCRLITNFLIRVYRRQLVEGKAALRPLFSGYGALSGDSDLATTTSSTTPNKKGDLRRLLRALELCGVERKKLFAAAARRAIVLQQIVEGLASREGKQKKLEQDVLKGLIGGGVQLCAL